MLTFLKNYFFSEIYGIMPSIRVLGLRNATFGGFSPKQRGPQEHFSRWPRRAHNLGFNDAWAELAARIIAARIKGGIAPN